MATLTFDKTNQIIEILAPTTSITVEEIYARIRDWEEDLENMEVSKVCDASGGEDLGGGVAVGITLKLLDWTIQFEARPGPSYVSCEVTGGNLVAVDETDTAVQAISPTAFVTVVRTSSSSATIATLEIEELKYRIAAQRNSHQAFGRPFYWDPVNGDDANSGTSATTARKTFAATQSLATAGAGDIIFALAPDSAQAVSTERMDIDVAGLSVKGPGRNFLIKPTDKNGGDVFHIDADNVLVSGFIVETANTSVSDTDNEDNCFHVEGAFSRIENCWINKGKHGLLYAGGSYHWATHLEIEKHWMAGVMFVDEAHPTGSPREAQIENCHIYANNNGIILSATSASSTRLNRFQNNYIYDNSGWGFKVGADVSRTIIGVDNTFHSNALGDVEDLGTNTHNDQEERYEGAASAMWDKATTDHTTAGTFGKKAGDALTEDNFLALN